MTRRSGFSLAEFVIATTIVAVTASVAIPAATSRRILANEACAVVALRDIASAQARFQAAKFVDIDDDGVGEYGLLRELTGATGVRNTYDASVVGAPAEPPLLPTRFGVTRTRYEVSRAGYQFRVVLPGIDGAGVPELTSGALVSFINSNLSETTWGCYAWPQRHGRTGGQTFFTNQTGDIVACESRAYSGSNVFTRSNAGAAFAAGGDPTNITGQLAIGTVGRDGNVWRLVTPRAEERDFVSRGTLRTCYTAPYRCPRTGSVTIKSKEHLTYTHETLVIRASGLRAGIRYTVSVAPHDFGRVVPDDSGRATFRFDSAVDAYPAGLSSLRELAGTRLELQATFHNASEAVGVVGQFVPLHDGARLSARLGSDEAATIAALREIATAQAQFRASGVCDVDYDGVGEFGLFRELSGVIGVRNVPDGSTQRQVINPPVLSRAFGVFNTNHEVSRSGYLFHMVLPGTGGLGVMEVSGTASLAAALDSDLAATTWCCYAWPRRYGKTGTRAFFINQSGDIVATDVKTYSGTQAFVASNAGAAFQSGWSPYSIIGQVATGTRGRDGNIWRLVPSRPADHESTVHGTLASVASGSLASGTFALTSHQLRTATSETIDVRVKGISTQTPVLLVFTDASSSASTALEGWIKADGSFTNSRHFFGRYYPIGDIVDLPSFSAGTIELRDGTTVVLRGVLPEFATIGGPHVPGSSVVFHVAKPLDAAPNQLPRRGSFDVRVTNAPEGTREELTIDVTTYDRDADPYGVFVLDEDDVATPLGTIAVRGLRGTGRLTLDTARGDVIAGGGLVALSGRRLEVRTPTGFVVLTGTLPVVE